MLVVNIFMMIFVVIFMEWGKNTYDNLNSAYFSDIQMPFEFWTIVWLDMF